MYISSSQIVGPSNQPSSSMGSKHHQAAAKTLGALLVSSYRQSSDQVQIMANSLQRVEMYLLAIVVLCYFMVLVGLVVMFSRICAPTKSHLMNDTSSAQLNMNNKGSSTVWTKFTGNTQQELPTKEFRDVGARHGMTSRRTQNSLAGNRSGTRLTLSRSGSISASQAGGEYTTADIERTAQSIYDNDDRQAQGTSV